MDYELSRHSVRGSVRRSVCAFLALNVLLFAFFHLHVADSSNVFRNKVQSFLIVLSLVKNILVDAERCLFLLLHCYASFLNFELQRLYLSLREKHLS